LQRNAYGSVGAALAIDFRESVTIRSDPLLRRVHRIRPVKALRYSRLRSDSEVEVNNDQPAGFSFIYKDNCAACHTDAGTGAARLFPRLAGSSAVQSDDATTLIHTVLFGSQAAATPGAPTGPAMPSFAWRLGDAQAAAVVTYIRNAWGNAAATVSPDQIRTVRGKRGRLD